MKKNNNYIYKIFRIIFLPIFKLIFRPQIVNKHYIPKEGKAIIAGNHKHALDPILVDTCTNRVVHTLAKKDLHDGIFGFFFRAVGTIPVDLKSTTNKNASNAAIDKLNEGNLINLSPEAKRNFTNELLLPFKYGAVSMAKKTNSKIIPYSITGEYKLFSKNLKIVYGKPIDVSNMNIEEANEKLYNSIKELLVKNMDKKELKTKNISKYSGIKRNEVKYYDFSKDEKKLNTNWYKYYEKNTSKHLDYPDVSIYEMLESNSKKRMNYIAYNYFDKKVKYKDFFKQINACSKSLKEIGVNQKDRVTICMPNTPEALMSFYAINKIGATSSMIHPLSAENEIKHYLNISNSKVLITIDLSWDRIKNILKETKVEKVIIVSVKESMPLLLKYSYILTKERKINKHKK